MSKEKYTTNKNKAIRDDMLRKVIEYEKKRNAQISKLQKSDKWQQGT